MSTVKVLSEIKKFIDKNVAPDIKLRLPNDKNTTEYSLTNPNTFIGWIPPKEYLPDNLKSSVPCIVVGLDDGEDNNIVSLYKIRLTVVVYSQLYSPSKNTYSNFDGYVELLNFIDLAKAKLRKNTIINKYVILDSEIKWGMYLEQPLPYWYGYIIFSVRNNPYPAENLDIKLNNL